MRFLETSQTTGKHEVLHILNGLKLIICYHTKILKCSQVLPVCNGGAFYKRSAIYSLFLRKPIPWAKEAFRFPGCCESGLWIRDFCWKFGSSPHGYFPIRQWPGTQPLPSVTHRCLRAVPLWLASYRLRRWPRIYNAAESNSDGPAMKHEHSR